MMMVMRIIIIVGVVCFLVDSHSQKHTFGITLKSRISSTTNQHFRHVPRGGGGGGGGGSNSPNILIIGSVNVDTFLPVQRLPSPGENIMIPSTHTQLRMDIPGGKGCNQAIACRQLISQSSASSSSSSVVSFVCQFGNDKAGKMLKETLIEKKVDIEFCGECQKVNSGRGYVFLEEDGGEVSAVVFGGSNIHGWTDWLKDGNMKGRMEEMLKDRRCVLLQREIPESVNLMIARHAKESNVLIVQDLGGDDRRLSEEMLRLCDFLIPNETELERLVHHYYYSMKTDRLTQQEQDPIRRAMGYASYLQKHHGANAILVTLGPKGSILLLPPTDDDNSVCLFQKACTKLPGPVVDETGAGDCYRAAFAVALCEKKSWVECMRFASAAGALAVTKEGAVPSIPDRKDVEDLCRMCFGGDDDDHEVLSIPRGGEDDKTSSDYKEQQENDNNVIDKEKDNDFPLMFGSRLNSMKDRPDLTSTPPKTVSEWIERQSTIRGLDCIDFNYPQHFQTQTPIEAKRALQRAHLKPGAVCLRYPSPRFSRGAMNHPDPTLRREAVSITKEAARTAQILGCDEVVVWSAFDGYDYPFQVRYDDKWDELISAFRECCDEFPHIRFSLEFKPTDENTRFFTVPTTGAALLLVQDIDRPNMGLTLDVGHMLMAGENPGQSIAMVGKRGKLFGIQLNDGYTRLAAEDGLMFGSVHPSMALEVLYQLQRVGYEGHLYFDTFPQRTDPVGECEYNIRRVKKFWKAAGRLDDLGIGRVMEEHDALGALELVEKVLEEEEGTGS